MKIVTDTGSLYSPKEGEELGVAVLPLSVTVNGNTYVEYVDISSQDFLTLVKNGGIPTSSQPSVGRTLEEFEKSTEETLVISMADGLSGTYQSAVGAKNSIENNDHIHVLNSRTLCGPQRYLVQKAMILREEGLSFAEIKEKVQESIEASISFLIPSDFDFLRRGGRLTPLAATIGGLMKIVPVMTQTEDGKRLEKFTTKRTMKKAVEEVCDKMESVGVNENYILSISHAGVEELAKSVLDQVHERFPNSEIELFYLSPAFITQGGPGCVAIQAIKK